MFQNSKHTLSSNLVNQVSSIIIFLLLPNILSLGDYAQTIFISVLMSFIILAELGVGFTFGRIMPSIFANEKDEVIEKYKQTFTVFIIVANILGSVLISLIYYIKYEDILNTILLMILNPIIKILQTYIQIYSLSEDFKNYKNKNIIYSSMRLIFIIPISYVFGLSGWIGAQILSGIVVLRNIKILKFNINKFDILILKPLFIEGFILLISFVFWQQLLNSSRLFATLYFDDKTIALYGLLHAGYAILLSLFISIFIPVTISSLKTIKNDPKNTINKLLNSILKSSIVLFPIIIISIEITPYLYNFFFPKYDININILKYQLLSLSGIPILTVLGTVFVGLKHPVKLLIIYSLAFLVSYLVMVICDLGIIRAAVAQFVGIMFLSILLLFSTMYFFKEYIEDKVKKTIQILMVVFFPYLIYYFLRCFI